MSFSDNISLFGADPMERIVAVEFREPDLAVTYVRDDLGGTSAREERFQPFLWSAETTGHSTPLGGDATLRHLSRFSGWGEFLAIRDNLKKTGIAHFAQSDPVQQILVSTGRTLFKGMDFEDLRRLQVDIETLAAEGFGFSNPARDAIAAIAVSDQGGWEELILVEPGGGDPAERAALERLGEVIARRDPDVIEGHNIFKFDLPFIAARAKRLKVRLAWGRDGSTLRSRPSRLQIAEKTIQYPKFTIEGRHIVDTWLLAQYYDVSSRELESFGLKAVARHFGLAEPDRVILEGAEIGRAHLAGDPAFQIYALQDVRETRSLAALLGRSYFIQAQIFPFGFQDVIVRGNATRIDALLLREYLRRGESIPDLGDTRPFEGGYTDIFFTGVAEGVWHCDIASLYPSVMLAFGYTPSSDRLGIFRSMLADLRRFRLEAKSFERSAASQREAARFNALQTTFKILINSFYGYLGFAQGHFADFDAAAAVTAKGREILSSMVAWLGAHGARVIEIDTDGIYFQPPAGATAGDLENGLAGTLPEGIEVEFDRRYRAMFSYKAKNYALLGEDGAITIRGAALKSRGMERFLREYLGELLRDILEGRAAEAAALEGDYERRLRSRSEPVGWFMKTESLQDSLAAYQKKIGASTRNRSAAFEVALRSGLPYQAGDQVTYYIGGTKRKVTAYEAAKPTNDWDPEGRDENVEYYVGKLSELAAKFRAFLPEAGPQGQLML